MATRSLQVDGLVLHRRPPTEKFQAFSVFSASQGVLTVHQRVTRKAAAPATALDLFDEVSLTLTSSNQGQTWFVKEARIVNRPDGIGRDYASLQAAARISTLVRRNEVDADTRPRVIALLQASFAALSSGAPADAVLFKSFFRFAREEGYAVREQWLGDLPPALRQSADAILANPVASQSADPNLPNLQRRLEDFLRGHTDVLVE